MEKFKIMERIYFLLVGIQKSYDISNNEIRGLASFMGLQVSHWGTSFEGPKAVFSPLDCLFKVESCKIKDLP